jgi:hypothetical protein
LHLSFSRQLLLPPSLPAIDDLTAANDLNDYHLLRAARADLLRRLGLFDEAATIMSGRWTLSPTIANEDFSTGGCAKFSPRDGRDVDENAGVLRLPAAAQGFVDLHKGQQFVEARLRQA